LDIVVNNPTDKVIIPIVIFAIWGLGNKDVVPIEADPAKVAITIEGNVIAVCNLEYNFSERS